MRAIDAMEPLPEALSRCDLYIAAASFEYERSVATTSLLATKMRAGCTIIAAFTGRTSEAAQDLKNESRAELFAQMMKIDSTGLPRVISIGRYDYGAALRELRSEIEIRGLSACESVVVDISCFTAVQLVFLIRWLYSSLRPRECFVTYCRPHSYSSEGDDYLTRPRYQTIPLPIRVMPRSTRNEIRRVAIVVLGHEGVRSLTAWRSVDPENTILLFPASGSAKFDKICELRNRYLLGLSKKSKGFSVRFVETVELTGARAAVSEELLKLSTASTTSSLRVSLIPFGPKPLIVAATLAVLDASFTDFELAYAIPRGYSGLYSSGATSVFFEQIRFPKEVVGF